MALQQRIFRMSLDQRTATTPRKSYDQWLSAGVRLLARAGVRPNALTYISLAPAILAGFAAAGGAMTSAALLLLFSGALDLLDGAMARETGQTSRLGALLDSSIDRLCDAAILAGLAVFYAPYGSLVIIPIAAIVSGFIIPYIRARAEGLAIRLTRLWMRRQDRLVVIVAALLLSLIPLDDPVVPAPLTLGALALLALLNTIAAVWALAAAARDLQSGERQLPGTDRRHTP
jgi:CDP-diacylglycerol--glycerol-3-phosphate 3-phosphatidyltransferase